MERQTWSPPCRVTRSYFTLVLLAAVWLRKCFKLLPFPVYCSQNTIYFPYFIHCWHCQMWHFNCSTIIDLFLKTTVSVCQVWKWVSRVPNLNIFIVGFFQLFVFPPLFLPMCWSMLPTSTSSFLLSSCLVLLRRRRSLLTPAAALLTCLWPAGIKTKT